MDNRFRRYFAFVLIPLLCAYLADKALFVGHFEDYFLRTASFLNYEHKDVLLEELAAYLRRGERKKVLVIFGNSRTMPFDNRYIEKRHPGWVLYNFSVPGGTSDYYYRYMQEFRRMDLRPDFIYFAVSPQGFNAKPQVAMDEVMVNGLPVWFVLQNMLHYSLDDLSNYTAKKLSLTYRYRPKLFAVALRMKPGPNNVENFRRLLGETKARLLRERGSVPYTDSMDALTDQGKLELAAENTWKDFFSPFVISENQIYFTEEFLRIASEMRIAHLLLWVKVEPHLRRLKAERPCRGDATSLSQTVRGVWESRIDDIATRHGTQMLDMNYGDSIACDSFYDASHMAAVCFPEFTDYLFGHIDSYTRKAVPGVGSREGQKEDK